MKSKFLNYILPVLLFSIIWGAVEFLLPVKYSEAHISVGLVSILFAISSIVSLLLDIPAGKLSDRIGRERLITYSVVVATVALIILYYSSSFIAFLIAGILIGIAYGLNWSPLLGFVSDRTEDHNQGGIFGGFFALDGLGEAIAPLVVVFIALYTNMSFPFLVLALLALLCALIFRRLIKPLNKSQQVGGAINETFSYKSSLQLIKKATGKNIFLFALGFFAAFFWQSVWFTQPLIGFYEHSLLGSALIVVAFALPTILFSNLLGKLIDKIKEKKVFFSSIILVIVSFVLFYFSSSLLAKIIFIFIAAIGVFGIRLVMNVLVVKTNSQEERGEFFGIIETIRDISFAVAPLFIGFTYKIIGLDGVFIVNSGIAILLLIFGISVFSKNKYLDLYNL